MYLVTVYQLRYFYLREFFSCSRVLSLIPKHARVHHTKCTHMNTRTCACLETQDCQRRSSQEQQQLLHKTMLDVTKSPVSEPRRSVTVYMVTPTYARWTQKADLTRLCQTLMHVRQIHWIVVEDAVYPTPLVTKLLRRCTVPSTHLHTRTPERLRLKEGEPTWRKCRGVEQRNAAIEWLRNAGNEEGVVYFGDDDNTYDIELFEQVIEGRCICSDIQCTHLHASHTHTHTQHTTHTPDEGHEEGVCVASWNMWWSEV